MSDPRPPQSLSQGNSGCYCLDRRPELGFKLALECRRSIVYPVKNKNSKYNNNALSSEEDGAMANVNESNHNTAKV